MCYILSSSDSSSSFKDSCLKKESVIKEQSYQLFYNSACNKQNEVCCSFTALSLCPNPCRQQDSSHQCTHFGRKKAPLVAGSELTVSESKNYPGYTVAFPAVPSQYPQLTRRGGDVCWNDTFSSSLSSEALQQHPRHSSPWRISLLLL